MDVPNETAEREYRQLGDLLLDATVGRLAVEAVYLDESEATAMQAISPITGERGKAIFTEFVDWNSDTGIDDPEVELGTSLSFDTESPATPVTDVQTEEISHPFFGVIQVWKVSLASADAQFLLNSLPKAILEQVAFPRQEEH